MNAKSMKIGLLMGLFGSVLMLSACNEYVAKTNKEIETTLERVETYQQRATIPDLPVPVDTVRVQDDVWLGNSSVKIMEGDALPAWLEKEDSVTIAIAEQATLPTLAQEITDMTGIEVRLDDLKSEGAVPEETVPVQYSGKLSGLLGYLSNRYGVWWRYKNGVISFFTKETRVFTIYALPTETQMQASLTGATMGENSGGGNSSLSTSANLTLWENIEEGVKQVVGENGSLSFSRVAGTVTVTASPFIIQKVATYVANWNEKLSRQVAISVKVLQVTISNEDNYGLDLQAVFNSNNISASFTSPYMIDVSGGTSAGLLSMTLLRPSSNWKDTKSIIQAFSTQGKASLVTSSSVTTLNNKVAPVQIATSQNYVRESSVTRDTDDDSDDVEVNMETDTLNYGFTMEILPRILDHGRLIVLFSMTLTDLLSLDSFSSNSGYLSTAEDETDDDAQDMMIVQLPKIQMRGFMQEIAMKSGSTLVLTGFESVNNKTQSSGIGQAKMGPLGGQAYNKNTRDVMVIMMTPEILESPLSPEARMRDF